MAISLTQPSIGSTSWGTQVNTNFQSIQTAINAFLAGSAIKTGASVTLTSADKCMWLRCADASAQAVALPAANALIAGDVIAVLNDSTPSGTAPIVHTVSRSGTDTIKGSTGSLTSIALLSTNFIILESDGTSTWRIVRSRLETSWIDGGAITITATTTAPTKPTTRVRDRMYWRRKRDSMEVRYEWKHTSSAGSAAGSGSYLFALPFSADTSHYPNLNTDGESVTDSLVWGACSCGYGGASTTQSTTTLVTSKATPILNTATTIAVQVGVNTAGMGASDNRFQSSGWALTLSDLRFSIHVQLLVSGWAI